MADAPSTADPVAMMQWVQQVVDAVQKSLDLIDRSGLFAADAIPLHSVYVAELTGTNMKFKPSPAGRMVYCVNETGGAVPAFSDGTVWRRVTDRAVVS